MKQHNRSNHWILNAVKKREITGWIFFNFRETSAQSRQTSAGEGKRVDTKQRKLLSVFLMLACGSEASLHLWQYAAHRHIRPALRRGQIAILLRDEVSLWIDYISTITQGKRRKEDNFSLWVVTPARTLICWGDRCAPARAVTTNDLQSQSERRFTKVMIILASNGSAARKYTTTQTKQRHVCARLSVFGSEN